MPRVERVAVVKHGRSVVVVMAVEEYEALSSLHAPTLVGIDHGFSFPLRYFEVHRLLPDWPSFLDNFQRHWPTDEDRVRRMSPMGDGLRDTRMRVACK